MSDSKIYNMIAWIFATFLLALLYMVNYVNPGEIGIHSDFIPDGAKNISVYYNIYDNGVLVEYEYENIKDLDVLVFTSKEKMAMRGYAVITKYNKECYYDHSDRQRANESVDEDILYRLYICNWENDLLNIRMGILIDELKAQVYDNDKMFCRKCKISIIAKSQKMKMFDYYVGGFIAIIIQLILFQVAKVYRQRTNKL